VKYANVIQLHERLQKEGVKTHKERVEELNKYLSNLSEHHDMYVLSFHSFISCFSFKGLVFGTVTNAVVFLGQESDLDNGTSEWRSRRSAGRDISSGASGVFCVHWLLGHFLWQMLEARNRNYMP
jgi:hypothetical protein